MTTTKKHSANKCDFNPSYRWLNLANAYLDLANIGLSYVKEKKNLKILLPAIYCIKHGVELYLKGLNVEADYRFLQTHNQKKLCSEIYSQLSFSAKKVSDNMQALSKFIEIVKNYHSNLIGGQKLFESADERNDKFRYLQKERYVYNKLKYIDIKQVKEDIKNIKVFGNLLNIDLQLNKNQLNTAIFFNKAFSGDIIWPN